jgi:hypothetical protein
MMKKEFLEKCGGGKKDNDNQGSSNMMFAYKIRGISTKKEKKQLLPIRSSQQVENLIKILIKSNKT